MTLNCAAVPAELIESELFGHEKGSFTGAASRHIGKFEQAHNGTLFLDEIGDMPLVMQAKLLRVLEEGQVERVGGDRPIAVDVRVMVATHRNLDELVKKGGVPAGSVSSHLRLSAAAAAAAGAVGRYPGAGGAFRARRLREQNGWKPKPFRRRRSGVAALSLAGKRARAAQRSGAAAAAGGWTGGRAGRAVGAAADGGDGIGGRRRAAVRRLARPAGRFLRARPDSRGVEAAQSTMTDTAKALGLERSHLYKKCQAPGNRPAGAAGSAGVMRKQSRNVKPPIPEPKAAREPIISRAAIRHVLLFAALAAVVFIAYSNSFRGLLLLDNERIILKDTRIRAATAENIHLIMTGPYWQAILGGLYRPLSTLSYLWNYAVLGDGTNPRDTTRSTCFST